MDTNELIRKILENKESYKVKGYDLDKYDIIKKSERIKKEKQRQLDLENIKKLFDENLKKSKKETDEEKLDSIDIEVIERYLRRKKLKELKKKIKYDR